MTQFSRLDMQLNMPHNAAYQAPKVEHWDLYCKEVEDDDIVHICPMQQVFDPEAATGYENTIKVEQPMYPAQHTGYHCAGQIIPDPWAVYFQGFHSPMFGITYWEAAKREMDAMHFQLLNGHSRLQHQLNNDPSFATAPAEVRAAVQVQLTQYEAQMNRCQHYIARALLQAEAEKSIVAQEKAQLDRAIIDAINAVGRARLLARQNNLTDQQRVQLNQDVAKASKEMAENARRWTGSLKRDASTQEEQPHPGRARARPDWAKTEADEEWDQVWKALGYETPPFGHCTARRQAEDNGVTAGSFLADALRRQADQKAAQAADTMNRTVNHAVHEAAQAADAAYEAAGGNDSSPKTKKEIARATRKAAQDIFKHQVAGNATVEQEWAPLFTTDDAVNVRQRRGAIWSWDSSIPTRTNETPGLPKAVVKMEISE